MGAFLKSFVGGTVLLAVVFLGVCCHTARPVTIGPVADQAVPHGALVGEVEEVDVKLFTDLIRSAVQAHATRLVYLINSGGGDLETAYRIANLMDVARDHGVRVECVVDGYGASAAYFILQRCDRRVMTKRSILALHNPSLAHPNPDAGAIERQNEADQVEATSIAFREGSIDKTRVTAAEYVRRTADGRLWFVSWAEALALGMVDATVDEPRALWAR